ncbi:amino acid adenylation domain-containing protein [Streptomyces sp. WMMC500]|uniref:non-ribosomal peptide synthetase n=1 Tax=Streptomyces sp. WMMC500 TaxID=3015154 RepID=UPI00248C3467|nr:amino acid adenylation domain-containing protein [Streptomyces sp. WMMC500]WBB62060.1 amino acid adenylation domain-containing protein [Streptomyces sp. WMMC500]
MFDLSPSQEIVWLHEQLLPGSRSYNFTAVLNLRGVLDPDALRAAFATVVAHHPGLRLELVDTAGQVARQRIREEAEPRWRVTDLSPATNQEAAFLELLAAEAEEPIDTGHAPLLRWHLVRLGERHHRLVQVEHHLTHDGHSFAILLHDAVIAYRAHLTGQRPDLAPTRSYEEHVLGGVDTSARAASLAYWQDELRGMPLTVPLPGLSAPGAVRRNRGGQLRQHIDADLAERLRTWCRTCGYTPFSTLLTLFGELLRRHSGQRELVVGTAVGNRPDDFDRTIGMFVNTIPLGLRLRPDATAADAVDDVTDALLRALPHQELPVQQLTRSQGLHTSGADNPLFNVMFSAHDAPLPELDVPGLDISLYEGHNTGTTRFDLDLVLLPDDRRIVGQRNGASGMTLIWDYDSDLLGPNVVRLMSERFLALVDSYVSYPWASLDALAVPPSAGPPVPARAPTLADPLSTGDPDALAVLAGEQQLSYGELDKLVATLVDRLRAAGVTEGQPVATLLPRGVDSVVALLACLRLGAVYAPLSPSDPAARLAQLLARLRPALVLATRHSALAPPGGTAAYLEDPAFPTAAPARVLAGGAYVIHTSGSTGVPKPVLVSRPALAGYLDAIAARYGLGDEDRVLAFAQPSFDVAIEEVLPSLAAGACLVFPRREVPTGPELAAVLALRGVTVANLPTSYFLATRESLREVARDGRWSPRLVVLGGERLPARALRGLLADTGAVVCNAYGVTEAVVTSIVHTVTEANAALAGDVPLGVELPGVRVHVLDDGARPLPDGAVGELAVGGPMLADGYVGDDEATAARFVTAGGERVYLTGDQGYRDLGGRLWFLGRRDNQVKLRGHRIELEEIESVVSATLGGRPCAVVLDQDAETGPRLVGFVQGKRPNQAVLGWHLPGALVPGTWIALAELPTLPGGKPDRDALTRLAAEHTAVAPQRSQAGFTAPGQSLVARGWRAVLGHDGFAEDSHFFEVGGHSLLAAQLAAWLEPHLGARPALRTFFQHPVLADQAKALTSPGSTNDAG